MLGVMANQEVTRKILDRIERDPAISQKKLAEEIGISVGMINWHVKRCVTKGLIKLQQAPVHRYLYYLTPDGFSEKARLTAMYLQSGFNLFRRGREQYNELFRKCETEGWCGIVLLGQTELTELAFLVSSQYPEQSILGIISESKNGSGRNGFQIHSRTKERLKLPLKSKVDAVFSCRFAASSEEKLQPKSVLKALKVDESRYLIPEFLQ